MIQLVMPMHHRKIWADKLRIFATISVIAIHTLGVYRSYLFNNHIISSYLIFDIVDCIARMAVPTFFMLTGAFALTKKTKNKNIFYKKAFVRIFIPFILFSIINYLYVCHINSVRPTITALMSQIINYPGTEYHLWFMYIILIFYLFMPFLQKMVRSLDQHELLTLITVIFLLGNLTSNISLIAANHDKYILNGISLPSIVVYLNYLFIGYYLSKYGVSKHIRRIIYIIGILSIFLLPFLSLTVFPDTAMEGLVNGCGVLPFFIAISIFIFAKYKSSANLIQDCTQKISTKIMVYLSTISFFIYMIHVPIMETIQRYVFPFNPNSSLIAMVMSAFACIGTTFLASSFIAMAFSAFYNKIVLSKMNI